MSCLAPTWLRINKLSPITRSMVTHFNPEDSMSLAHPPGVFITPALSDTLQLSFPPKVLAVTRQCSHPPSTLYTSLPSLRKVSQLTLYSSK